MSAPAVPPSVRVFIAGNSGSGKTTLAYGMYLSKSPRVIILDMTGEWEGKTDYYVESVADLIQLIQVIGPTRPRWTVAIALDPDELPRLVAWLVPVPKVHSSPVIALRGVMLLVDEVDLIAPASTSTRPIRTLYRRGRHAGLSIVSTTQRPANVSREVSAQCRQVVMMQLNEPRDVDYMVRLLVLDVEGTKEVKRWHQQHPHGALWVDLDRQVRLWVPDSGKPQAQGPGRPQAELFVSRDAGHGGR